MKKLLNSLLIAACLVAAAITLPGCKSQRLEPGGAYAPTNSVGEVVYNDINLAILDASHKLAYDSLTTMFRFERDNRAALRSISPQIKRSIDKVRVQATEADVRWVMARNLYRQNPTPAGLSSMQTILLEIQRSATVAQSQLTNSPTLTNP